MTHYSVGTTRTEIHRLQSPLRLECGAELFDAEIAYEQYGSPDNPVILLCHALSGNAHAAGVHVGDTKPGWWDGIIGEGKALDTSRYCIICTNVIGGCAGSTGPASCNPQTGKPYGREFPVITITDMVNAQHQFLTERGISHLYAVIGGSMGGMQTLTWAVMYPDFLRKAVVIASSGYSTPMQIAFNAVQRAAVLREKEGGLALARMMAHITYLSEESMYEKFGRRLQYADERAFDFSPEFSVESYLSYQGESFVKRFDADSYLYITKALDYYDLTKDGSLAAGLSGVKAQFLVLSVSSDWLYPSALSGEIVSALSASGKSAEYAEIISPFGHDGFLLEFSQLNYLLGKFLTPHTVADLMVKNPPVIHCDATLAEAAKMMVSEETDHLPVVSSDGTLKGIVTSFDVAKSVAFGISSLREVMTTAVVTAEPDELLADAGKRLEQYHISALPVVSQGKVVGMLTSDSLASGRHS